MGKDTEHQREERRQSELSPDARGFFGLIVDRVA
jgi:hypothetical protein